MWYPRNGLKRAIWTEESHAFVSSRNVLVRQEDRWTISTPLQSVPHSEASSGQCSYVGAGMPGIGIVLYLPVTMEVWTFWERIFSWLLQHGQRRWVDNIAIAFFTREDLVQYLFQCLGKSECYSLIASSKCCINFLGDITLDLCSFLLHILSPYSVKGLLGLSIKVSEIYILFFTALAGLELTEVCLPLPPKCWN